MHPPSPWLMAKFQIFSFVRYRDDVFVIYGNASLCRRFLHALRTKMKCLYTFELEHFDVAEVPMLDMMVSFSGDRVVVRPYFKPSRRDVPLHTNSSHHKNVMGWPIARVYSLANRCNKESAFIEARRSLVARYAGALLDYKSLIQMSSCDAYNEMQQRSSIARSFCCVAESRVIRFTLVLPYHPLLVSCGIHEVVQECVNRRGDEFSRIYGSIPVVRIAWKNSVAPLHVRVRSCYRYMYKN